MTDTAINMPLACIILAAGRGARMKSALPKVMHEAAGRPLVNWVMDAVSPLAPERIIVVAAPGMQDVANAVTPYAAIAFQETPRGTADAVRAALPLLKGFKGDVLILAGDMPLLAATTLRGLVTARHKDAAGRLAVLGAEFEHPPAFGRLLRGADGSLAKIREDKDCSPDERSIKLCNLGAYCVDAERLAAWIDAIGNKNAQGEYYFTDLVEIAVSEGAKAHIHVARDPDEALGVNSRTDLAVVERVIQKRLRLRAMDGGATLIDPPSVYFSWDTALGKDVIVEPNVFFGPGVTVADNAHIRAFSHLEGAIVSSGAVIGPHARLRPGAVIGADAKIGNFVEIKNATLGKGVKASHLAYIGDAEIGAHTNIGCGAITVNYDGANKHKTVIGEDVMVGSNVSLVAPIRIGDGAYLAAGSTITKDVPAEALAMARERQSVREGWNKDRKSKKKA